MEQIFKICPSNQRQLVILLSFGILASLSGCGKKNNDGNNKTVIQNNEEVYPDEVFASFLKETSFSCGEAGCPATTLLVAGKSLDSSNNKICSGSVIDQDTVLTSIDCVDLDTIDVAKCGKSLMVKEVNGKISYCEKIISAKQSYILFKVKGLSTASNLPWSDEPVEDQENVSVWSVIPRKNPKEKLPSYELIEQKCHNVIGSYAMPMASQNQSSDMLINDCSLLPSDTIIGAGILNKTEEVVGMIDSIAHQEELKTLDPFMIPGVFPRPYLAGVKLSCLSYFARGERNIPQECELNLNSPEEIERRKIKILKNFAGLEDLKKSVEVTLSKEDPFFDWVAYYDKNADNVTIDVSQLPRCFKNPGNWIKRYKGGFLNLFYAEKATLVKSWPTWIFRVGLNGDYLPKTYIGRLGQAAYVMEFSPKDLAKKKHSWVRVYDETHKTLLHEFSSMAACL